jgi:hypothetical protein
MRFHIVRCGIAGQKQSGTQSTTPSFSVAHIKRRPALSRTFTEQNFITLAQQSGQHERHEKAAAEYDTVCILRRIAPVKQDRSSNDEEA